MNSDDFCSKEVALQKRQRLHRIALVGVTVVYTLLWTGAFFGWGPMQLMLEENGAFEYRCNDGEQIPCSAQTARLLNVQLVAQLTLIFSPLVGIFVDAYGPFRLMCLVAGCACAGLISLTVAVSQHFDNLLFLTFILIGSTTVSSHIVMIQTGMLFEGVTRQRIISVLNTIFDAGALTYLALWAIQKATSVALEVISAVYLGCTVVVFGSAVYLWYVVVPVRNEAAIEPDKQDDTNDNMVAAENADPLDQRSSKKLELTNDSARPSCALDGSLTSVEDGASDLAIGANSADVVIAEPDSTSAAPNTDVSVLTESPSTSSTSNCYVLICERSPAQQLKSKQYLLLVVFFFFQGASNNFTLTTARDFLAHLGDDETGNKYLTIFTLMTPISIIGLPFMDYVLNHHGYHAGLQSINALALCHGVIKVSSDNLNVQVFGFFVFSFFRCFMFAITFSFLPTFLSVKVVGRGSGLLVLSQGISSLLNIALASLAIKQFGGNFFYPNLFYTLGVLPCIYFAWEMGKGIKREEKEKKLPGALLDEE